MANLLTLNICRMVSSPFEMKVRPKVEPKNVKVTGPGVSSKGIPASIPADFVVDTTEAGYGDLQVQVLVSVFIFILVLIWVSKHQK